MAGRRFDHRVQFQRAPVLDDGLAERLGDFADFGAPVWADKSDLSDGERWRAGAVMSSATTRFTVRFSAFVAGITAKDCLICDGVTYRITGLKSGSGRARLVEITTAANNRGVVP